MFGLKINYSNIYHIILYCFVYLSKATHEKKKNITYYYEADKNKI